MTDWLEGWKNRVVENSKDDAGLYLTPSVEQTRQLPLWPETARAAPSGVLRSALFQVTSKNREAVWQAVLTSWPGWIIKYTGWPLSQADLDVWLELLNLVKRDGWKVYTTKRGLLRLLGKTTGESNKKWLRDSLIRLGQARVSIEIEGVGVYSGTLVHQTFTWNDERRAGTIVLNPDLGRLFQDGYTWLELKQRRELKGNLAKWMHGYVSTHKATVQHPSFINVRLLAELSGSERKEIKYFTRDLKKVMEQLKNIGLVKIYGVKKGVLEFVKMRRVEIEDKHKYLRQIGE